MGKWIVTLHLLDTNVWMAVVLEKHVFHQKAAAWLAAQSTSKSILFCRATQQSLLRLLTTERVMAPYGLPPMNNSEAWSLYERFQRNACIGWAPEPRNLDLHWKDFTARATASPKLWMDAYLAAFAIGCNAALVTTDHAFAQFPGLKLHILLN